MRPLDALFPGARHGIIAALFMEPERWWTLDELCARLSSPPAPLRQELSDLAAGGVVLQQQQDHHTCFRPNPGCPFFRELQSIAAKAASLDGHSGRETILVVEDEPATLKVSRILLESWGYRVLEAQNASEAVEIFEKHEREIHLVLSDVVMPGMSGPELGELLRSLNPELRIVYMSGYHAPEALARHQAFLPKPFNPAGLARKIREELDK